MDGMITAALWDVVLISAILAISHRKIQDGWLGWIGRSVGGSVSQCRSANRYGGSARFLKIQADVTRGRANRALDQTNALNFRQPRLKSGVCALPVRLVRSAARNLI
jgi:hypothetical protein